MSSPSIHPHRHQKHASGIPLQIIEGILRNDGPDAGSSRRVTLAAPTLSDSFVPRLDKSLSSRTGLDALRRSGGGGLDAALLMAKPLAPSMRCHIGVAAAPEAPRGNRAFPARDNLATKAYCICSDAIPLQNNLPRIAKLGFSAPPHTQSSYMHRSARPICVPAVVSPMFLPRGGRWKDVGIPACTRQALPGPPLSLANTVAALAVLPWRCAQCESHQQCHQQEPAEHGERDFSCYLRPPKCHSI